jgi:ribosomal protein S18 acetylase RimI-like enzyme
MVGSRDINHFNEIIAAGYSYGAMDKGKLIGFILAVNRNWNNTMYIENLFVSEFHRGRGVGHKLIDQIKLVAKASGFRLIELETQNTNVPAIEFYLRQGFELTGINLKLYGEDIENEVALYLTHDPDGRHHRIQDLEQ